MIVTKQQLAINLLNYLQHKTSLEDLVDWAENAFMDGDIREEDPKVVSKILARIGVADVKSFGLTWEDCDGIMRGKHSA